MDNLIEDYLSALNLELNRETFISIYIGVKATLSEEEKRRFPTDDSLLKKVFDANVHLKVDMIYRNCMQGTDLRLKAAALRSVFIAILLDSAKTGSRSISILPAWSLLYKSLTLIPDVDLQASIGSQGFLSIPLYRVNESGPPVKLIRLHIWDDSLIPYIDRERTERFAIHCHRCHARSWIICGRLEDTRYDVVTHTAPSALSKFSIKWRDAGNVHRKTSLAVNTDESVEIKERSKEQYTTGTTYEIQSGDYHASTVGRYPSATLFMFDEDKGSVKKAYVVGPSDVHESEINRDQTIKSILLLEKIDKIINHG